MRQTFKRILFSTGLALSAAVCASAQTTEPQVTTPPAAQRPTDGDPIRRLNLSPEQREQIRVIRDQSREQRASVAQRLRESNRALQEVLENDNPEEVVVEQRLKEVAAAQAEVMRMRILSEMKIRRVLTPEQRVLLRTLRTQVGTRREERRIENLEQRQRRMENRPQRLRERRNLRSPAIRRTPRNPIL